MEGKTCKYVEYEDGARIILFNGGEPVESTTKEVDVYHDAAFIDFLQNCSYEEAMKQINYILDGKNKIKEFSEKSYEKPTDSYTYQDIKDQISFILND